MSIPSEKAKVRLEVARLILVMLAARREAARVALARRLGLPDDGNDWWHLWWWAEDRGGDDLRQVLFTPDALSVDLDRLEVILEIEAGTFTPVVDWVDIRNAASGVWNYCFEAIRKPQQFLTESFEGELPPIEVSITGLHGLILALAEVGILNAPERGRVSLLVFPDYETVRFEVRSSGLALADELVEIVTGDRPVSAILDKPDDCLGTKLALAFVNSVAGHYGGQAGAERVPGGGNSLWFALPIASGQRHWAEP